MLKWQCSCSNRDAVVAKYEESGAMNALALKTFMLYVSSVQSKKQCPSIMFNVFEYIVYLCVYFCAMAFYTSMEMLF